MKTFSLTHPGGARTALVGVLGLFCVASSLSAANPGRSRPIARSMMQGFAATALAADSLRDSERVFLGRATETTRQQMRLAEVGSSQAETAEVRSHALTLAGDFRELSDSLDALIRRKGGLAGAPVGATSENYQKLVSKTGLEFDREFVRAAAELSSSVMTLFERAAADAKDPEVRDFAAAQLPTLRAHRNTIAELKKTFE